jgi:hypothetical protein
MAEAEGAIDGAIGAIEGAGAGAGAGAAAGAAPPPQAARDIVQAATAMANFVERMASLSQE